jgi:hypothetical protein
MRVRDIFRSKKEAVVLEPWKQGDMPPSAFRLRQNMKSVGQGKSYHWRIVRFGAGGENFRVLILWNEGKQIYRATLGHEVGEVVRIVCVREFHAREPGWHCHAVSQCKQGVPVWNHGGLRRFPRGTSEADEFGVTSKERATALALRFYGVEQSGVLL